MRRYFSGAATLERRPMRSLRSPTAARTTRARAAYGEAEEFRAWRPRLRSGAYPRPPRALTDDKPPAAQLR